MTADDSAPADAFDATTLEAERRMLMSLAYRMLGTVADAEDAVQETYARWYRMPQGERDAIENPAAWLTRVASRICLDQLGSARARRERYVGEWLPEPLPGGAGMFATPPSSDPLDRVTLDESVSTALLVVLESLTPAERVAFVLHDVFAMPFGEIAEVVGRSPDACRQLASTARRHVRERRAGSATREQHDAVVRAFIAAAGEGDLQGLVAQLDPDVVLVSDGGGLASAARRPVLGADHVGRFILGLQEQRGPALTVSVHETADGLTLAFGEGGVVDSVAVLDVRDDRIARIWIMRNPEKLRLWNDAASDV
ncbi:RNA polymerase sigma factor SigJ [Agromyces humatus]|uniref:RNA polymerase sigma factor SigJ n=1 Tax=Agromyces humatus TaxID=279573 RepID=A0ABP4WDD3_9MICO|nr:RNA polymerase sigma factor SigJ [Agromyces humatus]